WCAGIDREPVGLRYGFLESKNDSINVGRATANRQITGDIDRMIGSHNAAVAGYDNSVHEEVQRAVVLGKIDVGLDVAFSRPGTGVVRNRKDGHASAEIGRAS